MKLKKRDGTRRQVFRFSAVSRDEPCVKTPERTKTVRNMKKKAEEGTGG
jgi:hypothetical protein